MAYKNKVACRNIVGGGLKQFSSTFQDSISVDAKIMS